MSEAEGPGKSKTVLAVKNNLLYDMALAPNIEVEIPLGKRWSFNTEYKCPWWLNSEHDFCYQLLSGGMEGRYWLGTVSYTHLDVYKRQLLYLCRVIQTKRMANR